MKKTTITEQIVVIIYVKSGEEVIGTVERAYSSVEEAESHHGIDGENVKMFRRKTIIEEEEID